MPSLFPLNHHLTSSTLSKMFTSPTLLLSFFAFVSSVHGLVIPATQELESRTTGDFSGYLGVNLIYPNPFLNNAGFIAGSGEFSQKYTIRNFVQGGAPAVITYDTEKDKHLVIQFVSNGGVGKIIDGNPAFVTLWQLPAAGTPGYNSVKEDLVWFFNPDNKQVTAGITDKNNNLVPVFFSKRANDRKVFVSTDYVSPSGIVAKDGQTYKGVELIFK